MAASQCTKDDKAEGLQSLGFSTTLRGETRPPWIVNPIYSFHDKSWPLPHSLLVRIDEGTSNWCNKVLTHGGQACDSVQNIFTTVSYLISVSTLWARLQTNCEEEDVDQTGKGIWSQQRDSQYRERSVWASPTGTTLDGAGRKTYLGSQDSFNFRGPLYWDYSSARPSMFS